MRNTMSGRREAGLASPWILAALAALPGLAWAQAAPAALPDASPQAQSLGEDPFAAGAFELESGTGGTGGAEAGGGPAGAARTEYLVGGTAVVDARALLDPVFAGYAASASASGRVFAKVSVPDYGILYASYGLSQAFFQGLAGSGRAAAVPPADLFSPSWTLTELHYSFDIGKRAFFRLGKQLLSWGPSRIWSPVDFVNSARADAFAAIDLRQGKPGLRVHVPMKSLNAFLFADFSGSVAGGAVRDPLESTALSGRVDAAVGGFEIGITGRLAAESQGRAGFDFSGDLGGQAVYGELAIAPACSGYDASCLASLGFSRSFGMLKEWTVSAEGLYNSAGSDLSGDQAAMAAATPLYMGRFYGYAALAGADFPSRDLSTTVSAIVNLSDFSYSIKLAESLDLPRSVPFTLSISYAGGGDGKEFTFLGGDGSLTLGAQTRIEF